MLQLNYIRENKDEVIRRLAIKNYHNIEIIEKIISEDDERKATQRDLENFQSEANANAKKAGELFKSGKGEEAEGFKKLSAALKEKIKDLEANIGLREKLIHDLLVQVPNAPSIKVPKGKTPEDNEKVYEGGEIPKLHEGAKPHWDLAAKYGLIDFELGVKLTGAGFPVYKGKGAKLQRALINFFLDRATEAGYKEIQPPILVNADSGYGTGQLPDKEGQMYYSETDKLYLIPTAEVPITNIYRDVILKSDELPIKNCGYTPCFRREAGSYGKDVRGLNRLHQFDKVEIVQIVRPEKSYEVLEEMGNYVGNLLQDLELPFRILRLCGGDMSFGSAMTYDFETYSAAQQKWLEVSSVSNFETFQSNRLKLRFKEGDGKTQLAHTLNGSALALPRIVACILENNQTHEGIKIPKVLIPYTGFEYISNAVEKVKSEEERLYEKWISEQRNVIKTKLKELAEQKHHLNLFTGHTHSQLDFNQQINAFPGLKSIWSNYLQLENSNSLSLNSIDTLNNFQNTLSNNLAGLNSIQSLKGALNSYQTLMIGSAFMNQIKENSEK